MEADPLTIMRARLLLASGQPQAVREALEDATERPGAIGTCAWVTIALAEDRLRREGYLRPEAITAAWQAHQRGQASFGYRLWSVLMFQAWWQRHGEGC